MKKGEKLDGRDYRIILALADNGMRPTDAANACYMHRNTVLYHMDKIYRLTGLDAHNFYDLQKLVKIAKGEADIARRVKQVLGEEDWERFKELFPLLREYW